MPWKRDSRGWWFVSGRHKALCNIYVWLCHIYYNDDNWELASQSYYRQGGIPIVPEPFQHEPEPQWVDK